MDWKKLKEEYICGGTSYRKLAEKYDISLSTLSKVAAKEKWAELKEAAEQESNDAIVKAVGKQQAKRMERLQNVADRLLTKIERAVDELDIQLYKNVKKTKVIEYKNHERPDKPTKEIINEEEKFTEMRTIIDRKGLQAVAAALKSVQEIHGLKSELDTKEQEARINKLIKDVESSSGDESEGYGVLLMPDISGELMPPSEVQDNG